MLFFFTFLINSYGIKNFEIWSEVKSVDTASGIICIESEFLLQFHTTTLYPKQLERVPSNIVWMLPGTSFYTYAGRDPVELAKRARY